MGTFFNIAEMKALWILVPVLTLFASCSEEKPAQQFVLDIEVTTENGYLSYRLTNKFMDVTVHDSTLENVFSIRRDVAENDTVKMIAAMYYRSHDCPVQHALNAEFIKFQSDSGQVMINPNINHPKELDYAVRMINSMLSDEYDLKFIDMQPAIEPDGKMRL